MDRRRFLSSTALLSGAALLPRWARAEEKQVIKIATVAPDGTPWAQQLARVKGRAEKAAGGSVKVKGFMGGALGDENLTAAECKRGAIQVWGGSTGALATLVPELGIFELPFLFNDGAEADHLIDHVIGKDIERLLEQRGFKLLFWTENGFRNFGTTFGPVKTLADLKGKKMRSQESDIHLAMYRALGASPVPIAVTEVLSSLQTKVVEGFDQTPLFTFAANWYQGIKHYTVSEAVYQPGIVVANREFFDSLKPEVQRGLTAEAQKEAELGRKGVRALEPDLLANFKASRIELHTLTAQERAVFAKACAPTHDAWAKSKGKAATELLKKSRAALAEYRAKHGTTKRAG